MDTRRRYWVYMMTNSHDKCLYIGITNDIRHRVLEHKHHLKKGFSDTCNLEKLVYVEEYLDVRQAIAREKQLKGWRRSKKDALIESINPHWLDLSATYLLSF